jgi:hypothetical protein
MTVAEEIVEGHHKHKELKQEKGETGEDAAEMINDPGQTLAVAKYI